MVPGMTVRRLISGNADLMKQIHRLGRHDSLRFQPAQKIRLRLILRGEEPYTSRNLLGEQFPELPQLDQGGVRITPKIAFCERHQPHKLAVVRC